MARRLLVARQGWNGGGCRIYKIIDDTATPQIGSLDNGGRNGAERDLIYPTLGVEIEYVDATGARAAAGDVQVKVQYADESDMTFDDHGVRNFGIVKPTTHECIRILADLRPVRRSLGDPTGVATASGGSNPITTGAWTPTTGNLLVASGCVNSLSGMTGITISNSLTLTQTQILGNVATVSGIAVTGFGAIYHMIGTGASMTVSAAGAGAANARGTLTVLEYTGQSVASPIGAIAAAWTSGSGTSHSSTVGGTVETTSAIESTLFKDGTGAITEGTGYTMRYELSSGVGNNDHLNHRQFMRGTPTDPVTSTGSSTAYDTVGYEIQEEAAAGLAIPIAAYHYNYHLRNA